MIEINSLTKKFQGGITAVDEMSAYIETGSIYGLVGSNGSGKSTLLRLISGVYKPDNGIVLIDGTSPYENPEVKSRLFFVSDNPYFIHQCNVMEMAKFYKMAYSRFSDERFNYLRSVFPIDPNMRIVNMSKGMQRQAALMLALSVNPDYLLLDEAFDGLDPVIRQVIKRLLADGITEHNMTAIISSHNLRELEDLCDHVGLLHKGKFIFNRELDDVKLTIQKVQGVFNPVPPPEKLKDLNILRITQQGSLLNMIIRGDREEIRQKLNQLNPTFLERVPPTLEEIFIYELEAADYDVNSILL